MSLDNTLYIVLQNLERNLRNKPIILGGVSGPNGGVGSNPAGFDGQLAQTYVAYDTTEAESNTTPPSGSSLVDNLNHIRYRISEVEALASGIDIQEQGELFATDVTVLNFEGTVDVYENGSGIVTVSITPSGLNDVVTFSGVRNEDLTSQVDGAETNFTVANEIYPGSLSVFYNGIKQAPSFYTVDIDSLGFTTTFVPASGDDLVVDYETALDGAAFLTYNHGDLIGLGLDQHPLYLTEGRGDDRYYTETELDAGQLDNRYYTETEIDFYFSQTIGSGVFNAIGDLLVGTGASEFGILSAGSEGQFLVVDSGTPTGLNWQTIPTSVIYQQIVFTVAGQNLAGTGTLPLRIYSYLPEDGTITEVKAVLDQAPTTTALRVNIKKGGTGIISGGYLEMGTGVSTATTSSFVSDAIGNDDYFQLEIVQGDVGASDLTVHVRYQIGG